MDNVIGRILRKTKKGFHIWRGTGVKSEAQFTSKSFLCPVCVQPVQPGS